MKSADLWTAEMAQLMALAQLSGDDDKLLETMRATIRTIQLEANRQGQLDMRERAAKACFDGTISAVTRDACVEAIRALSVEGE